MNEHSENFGVEEEVFATRPIEIFMVRHGKQERYEDPASPLSLEGIDQAKSFADDLIQHCGEVEKVVIKVKHSLIDRAVSTANIIENELLDIIKQRQLTNIKVLVTRHSGDLKTTGALGPVMQSGIKYEDSVDEWLTNAENYPDAKKPEVASNQIKLMIQTADRLVKRIKIDGPKIIYVWVTHETGHASLLNELTSQTTQELGGSIGHLEPMKIVVSRNNDPEITFRGQVYHLPD